MGCFFGCFRFKDSHRPKAHLISKSIASKSRDPLVTKNQLASVFLCEEKGSPCEQVRHVSLQESFDKENANEEELKCEAQFLKSCGALLETPAEIRKASKELSVQSPHRDGLSSKSCRKLRWDKQPGQVSDTPAKVHGDSHRQDNKSGGCHLEEYCTLRKAVQFEDDEHISGNESAVDPVGCDVSPTENQIQPHGSNGSPYPTPVNLTEEVQTPGTVYSLNLRTGNNTRIRTQYVYPVENSVEQHMGNSTQDANNIRPVSLSPVPLQSSPNGKRQNNETVFKEDVNFNQDTPKPIVPSLSEWLKPPPPKDDRWNRKAVPRERSHSDKSPVDDRPIIGIVAAHWNEDEPSRVSPNKGFDGNGIPNSTNKYKEDQKVSWHATPFEERLEKALSEEKFFPQRSLDGRPINLDNEGEESDTAAS